MTMSLVFLSPQVRGTMVESPQFRDGQFHNDQAFDMMGPGGLLRTGWRFMFDKPIDASPSQQIPLQPISAEQLENERGQGLAVYRLGHSSLLLNLAGDYWLIDPVFSERASPFKWVGPKRFHQPPISLAELPPIRGVIVSHDHYDHLDEASIRQLAERAEHFAVPLGVGDHLRAWGVSDSRIHELDWWQGVELGGVELTATPAQHFSGRGLTDGNRTLWASWVIRAEGQRLFYSGDTGYFDGFREIGKRFGPFDLTIMENGAYNEDWAEVHMSPEETLQAHLDLGGRALMPVHNSTFDLALHGWTEPLERLAELVESRDVVLATPQIGARMALDGETRFAYWWRELVEPQPMLRQAALASAE